MNNSLLHFHLVLNKNWIFRTIWNKHSFADSCFNFFPVGELQRQKEFEVAMFMYRTGEQQNAYNAMNSIKTHG